MSADGKRSIRYGDHEKTSTPNLHHYHEETWTWDSTANTINVANEVQRAGWKPALQRGGSPRRAAHMTSRDPPGS